MILNQAEDINLSEICKKMQQPLKANKKYNVSTLISILISIQIHLAIGKRKKSEKSNTWNVRNVESA